MRELRSSTALHLSEPIIKLLIIIMTLTRKGLRKVSWVVGSLGVAFGVTAFGYVSHAKGCTKEQIEAMQRVTTLCAFNAVGLSLISRRKKTLLIALPMLLLTSSMALHVGALAIDRFAPLRAERLSWMVPAGYGAAMAGWLMMALC